MVDPSDIAIGAGGTISLGAVGIAIAKKWWDERERKRDEAAAKLEALEEAAEKRVESKLDTVIAGQTRIEQDMRDLHNKLATQAGTVEQIDRRVGGLSADYGPRIKELELWRARTEGNRRKAR